MKIDTEKLASLIDAGVADCRGPCSQWEIIIGKKGKHRVILTVTSDPNSGPYEMHKEHICVRLK